MKDIVIIGGGVAGLSAAIHCAQRGLKPILIEGGSYPSHKICGEFFSGECLSMLKQWGIIPEVMIQRAHFFAGKQSMSLDLPIAAGSMSRYFFDNRLMQVAVQHGVDIQINTMVQAIHLNDGVYGIELSSGQKIKTSRLVIGTGRVTHLLGIKEKQQEPKFIGIKAHFRNPGIASDQVFFFMFPGAYLGISTIENDTINVACLARKDVVEMHGSSEKYMSYLASLQQYPVLHKVLNADRLFPEWLTVSVPGFGVRNTPQLPNAYFIGDAAGAIPPATGDGLAIALTTGQLVTWYLCDNNPQGFRRAWKRRYAQTIRCGLFLHKIMLSPLLSKMTISLGKIFPRLIIFIFKKTRARL